jgi:hypothetical protein
MAFGQGVQEDETLAAQLEPQLRRKVQDPVEVINVDVPGYNTCQEWWTFQERVLPLKPRIVVLLYVENDTDPPAFHVQGEEVISPDVRKGFPGNILAEARKRSALYNLIWMRWQAIKIGSFRMEHYRQILSQKFSDSNPGWVESRNCLTKLVQRAQAQSIRLIVIPMPVLWGLTDKPYPFECYLKTVSDAAGRAGAEVVEVLPLVQDRDLRARVSERDPHPSAEVFRRIAAKLAEILP